MSLIKQLAGEAAIYGLSSILGRILHFVILTPFLTRYFLPEQYGIINVLFTYVALLTIVFTYRLETAYFRFGSRENNSEQAFSTAFMSFVLTTTLFCGIGLLLQDTLSAFLNQPRQYLYWILAITGFDALAAIPFARLRLKNQPISFAILKLSGVVLNLAFVFIFLKGIPIWFPEFTFDAVSFYFLANVIASLLVLIGHFLIIGRIKLSMDRILWGRMIRYASPLILVSIAGIVNDKFAYVLLENLLPGDLPSVRSQIGLFGAAAKVAVLLALVTQAFNYAAEPFFFRHASNSDRRDIYGKVLALFTFFGCLTILGILFYIDLVQYIIGPSYRGGLDVVPVLLLANLMLGIYYNLSIWYKLADATQVGAYIAISGSVLTLIMNYFLIPQIGYWGSALAMLSCFTFMSVACYITGRSRYPIPYPIRRIALYIVWAMVIWILHDQVINNLSTSILPIKLGIGTLFLLLYLSMTYILDRKYLLSAIRS